MIYEDFNALPLIQSIKEGNYEQILEFLEANYKEYEIKENGEINKKTEIVDKQTQATPLFYVTARKSDDESVEIAKLLVEKYALCNPTSKDLMKQTCIFYAAREGHIKLCNYLIEKGCNPNDSDKFGQTCLFYASREGKTECLQNLIKKGANPNLLDFNKQTCLFYACRDGRYDTVKCLLENGVNSSIKDAQRRTALTFAKGNGHHNIINLLKNVNTLNKSFSEHHLPSNNLNSIKRNSSFFGSNNQNESNNNSVNTVLDHNNNTNIKNEVKDINEIANINFNNSNGIINSFCLSNMSSNKSTCFFTDKTLRKKYKLQYRPLEKEDPLLWLDAPLIKIKEFERKFPQLALWPKNTSVSNLELNNTNNAFSKQWYTSANQLIQSLSKYDGGHIFEKLVDPKKQNCPDYYDVIKNPMSFSCIKSKLKKGQYKSPTEFIRDVQLIFDNCNVYNTSSSLVAITGKNIESYFNNQLIVTGFNNFVSKEKYINELLEKVEEENIKWSIENEQKNKENEESEENKEKKNE